MKEYKQAGLPRIETKFKNYLNSTTLTTIEEEHLNNPYYSTNSAMTSN